MSKKTALTMRELLKLDRHTNMDDIEFMEKQKYRIDRIKTHARMLDIDDLRDEIKDLNNKVRELYALIDILKDKISRSNHE